MASRYVSETKGGKSISAYAILNRRHVHVANVQAYFSDSGGCLVNVRNFDEAAERTAKTLGTGDGYFQHGTASGYGYDKFTAALSGLVIDGLTLHDHCGHSPASERLFKRYQKAVAAGQIHWGDGSQKVWNLKAELIGAEFANWHTPRADENGVLQGNEGYGSLFQASGLKFLDLLGYRVIQVI